MFIGICIIILVLLRINITDRNYSIILYIPTRTRRFDTQKPTTILLCQCYNIFALLLVPVHNVAVQLVRN